MQGSTFFPSKAWSFIEEKQKTERKDKIKEETLSHFNLLIKG